jgi:hypothetical protein
VQSSTSGSLGQFNAALGKHHHHSSESAVDDVPPWIASGGSINPEAAPAPLMSVSAGSSSSGIIAKHVKARHDLPALTVPIFIMGDGKKGTEDEQSRHITHKNVRDTCKSYANMGEDEVDAVVRLQDSIYPARWPETLDKALEAINSVGIDEDSLEDVKWFAPVVEASRRKHHKCDFEFCEHVAHHIGCLLTHMLIWNQAHQEKLDHFVVMESDAYKLTSVSPLDFNNLAANLPEEADLVWLKPDFTDSGQFLKRFKSNAMGTWADNSIAPIQYNQQKYVYLYNFDKRCGWAGTPAYMLTASGLAKIRHHIKHEGEVDMIDAWLGSHCIRQCDDPHHCMNLNCYIAQTVPYAKQALGGYIPDWYDDDSDDEGDVREVPAKIVEALEDEHTKYNQLACEREGSTYTGWAPVGSGRTEDGKHVINDCLVFPWEQHHLNFCATDMPVDTSDMSMLGSASIGYMESGAIARNRLIDRAMATMGAE